MSRDLFQLRSLAPGQLEPSKEELEALMTENGRGKKIIIGQNRALCISSEYLISFFHFRSMQGRITAQAFSFDQQFKPYQKDEFLMVVLSPLYFKLTFFPTPPPMKL